MEKNTIVQKWVKQVDDPVEMGIKYYTLLSAVNDLGLTARETEILSYTSYRGSIDALQVKKDFCKRFGSTLATVGNLMTKLKKLKYLVRDEERKIVVNKDIDFNFESDFVIKIGLNGRKERNSEELGREGNGK